MKRVYERPLMTAELFEANEYVAACWGVSCIVNLANEVEEGMAPTNPKMNGNNNFADGQTHSLAGCGTASNQYLRDITGDGTVDSMQEYKSVAVAGSNWLDCKVYTNAKYDTLKDISSVNPGDYIYWTTSASDGRVWYHQGEAVATETAHPNRS